MSCASCALGALASGKARLYYRNTRIKSNAPWREHKDTLDLGPAMRYDSLFYRTQESYAIARYRWKMTMSTLISTATKDPPIRLIAMRIFLTCLSLLAAGSAAGVPVSVDVSRGPLKMLSEYHFFIGDMVDHVPNEGVIPYDMNIPLFSDFTAKLRFVWMPQGVSAPYDEVETFSFPVGTVLIKTFAYLNDIRDPSLGRRVLETRLLVHKQSGWVGLPYVWNEEQTEASLRVGGTDIDVEWIHFDGSKRTNNYIIPNMNECKSCHSIGEVLQPIGPKARNLNKSYDYVTGPENQLTRWANAGYLTGVPDPADAPRLALWDDPRDGTVDERARGYLEINCMHCHNPIGAANTTGLDLGYYQHDRTKLGIMKPPVAAGRATGDHSFDVVPGKPDESILVYRLESTDPGIMMPELPRRLVDEKGVAEVRRWVEGLVPDNQSPGARSSP